MFESEKKSPLDRLKKGLYSRNDLFGDSPRHDIRRIEHEEIPVSWEREGIPEEGPASPAQSPRPLGVRKSYKILFFSAASFLLIALAVGAFTLFGGRNFVSVDNMDILIDGPVSIGGGEPLSLNVSVNNKNNAEVELVDLIATYPQGTKDPQDPTKDLARTRLSLGTMPAGTLTQRTFQSLMFGEEGSDREVVFTVEYRTANSNAIFYKEKSYKLKLASSPVIVSVDALDRVLSGQGTPVTITISSNTTSVVKDLLLVLEYPSGYSVTSANPAATYSNNIWRIGDLAPGAKRVIFLNGSIQGEDGDTRTIHANIGIRNAANEREIATRVVSKDHSFQLEKPFLGLDLALNGVRTDNVPLEAGRVVRADVIWTNNSATRITGARIEAKLSGSALDRGSINVTGGYYDSKIDTIIWEAGRVSGLDAITPGDTNRVGFTFASKQVVPGKPLINPSMSVVVTARGNRVDETGVSQEVSTGVSRSIRLVSNLSLSSRILRSQGPFNNTGPIPPKVDQETTYTIVWTVTNTSNSINDARVTATLPPYVSWAGAVSPEGADVTYNPTGGQITWLVGSVPQNADVGSGARQVAFQVILRPSLTQAGSSPEVIGQSLIAGTDSFTGTNLTNSAPGLSTVTTTDPLWQDGQGVVTK
ncbi:MAG: hypothetical protein WC763_03190 [Candidatus Paceibacterota bacterium]|jgi:hypothetical protein